MKKAGFAFDAPLTARRALRQPGVDVPLAITVGPQGGPGLRRGSPAPSTSRRATPTSASPCASIYRSARATGRSLSATSCARDRADARHAGPGSARCVRAARGPEAEGHAPRAGASVPDDHHDRPHELQAAPVQAAEALQELRRRRRPARLPDADGRYAIQNKQVNPAWTAPNSPWAGRYAGTTAPGGTPLNPLQGPLDGDRQRRRHPRHGRRILDRHPRLARLHPHARRPT